MKKIILSLFVLLVFGQIVFSEVQHYYSSEYETISNIRRILHFEIVRVETTTRSDDDGHSMARISNDFYMILIYSLSDGDVSANFINIQGGFSRDSQYKLYIKVNNARQELISGKVFSACKVFKTLDEAKKYYLQLESKHKRY